MPRLTVRWLVEQAGEGAKKNSCYIAYTAA